MIVVEGSLAKTCTLSPLARRDQSVGSESSVTASWAAFLSASERP
jgi:hypothetical protein